MSEFTIRPLAAEDIPAVAALEACCFRSPWPQQAFEREIKSVYARYLTAWQGDSLAGYGGIWVMIGEAYVTNLCVDPSFRGQGLGHRLLQALMDCAYEAMGITFMTLHVRPSNVLAKALYLSMGFIEVEVTPGYYEDSGEDALVMACTDTTPWLSRNET